MRDTPDRLPKDVLVAYSAPTVAVTFAFMLMSLYYFKFATDVLQVAPGVMGLLYGASRLWDAASDPLAGYLSDRTRSRLGRRRSWMAGAAVPLAISLWMLWSPPADLSPGDTTLWVAVSLFFFYSAYTAFNVPHGALGAELTLDYHDRTRLYAFRQVASALGMLVSLLAFYALLETGSGGAEWLGVGVREVATIVGLAAGGALMFTAWVAVSRLHERSEHQGRGPARLLPAFRDVFRNGHAVRLMAVALIHHFGIGALSLLSAYLFEYVLRVPNWMAAVFVGSYALGIAISIPVWLGLTRRFGKHRCWEWSLWGLGFGYGSFFFVMGDWSALEPGLVLLIACSMAMLLGMISAAGWIISHSVQADVIDWDEYTTHERKEGAYLAVWNFIEKSGSAAAAALLGVVLQTVGYVPNQEQSDSTRMAILVLVSLVPAAGHFAAAWILRGFTLDEVEHDRIRAAIAAREPSEPVRRYP